MSFLFVDRILADTPGKHILGIKHVTSQDYYLMTSPTGMLFMPALIGETLGQLAAWSVIHAADYQFRPVAGMANQVVVSGHARPGEVIELESWIDEWDQTAVKYHSEARVNDRVIFTIGQAIGPMLPMTTLSDPEQVRREYAKIYRPGTFTPFPYSEETRQCSLSLRNSAVTNVEHILEWESGQRAVTLKCVSLSAPYFPDHFGIKPVLPLTILLQTKTQLAEQLLGDAWKLREFHKIKMSEFVQPGDVIRIETLVKSKTDQEASLQWISTVNEQRVCIATATFRKESQ